jgi:1,4-alpha-glucan branching enzyme
MRLLLFFLIHIVFSLGVFAQTVTSNPAVPSPAQPVTITFDVSGTTFATKNLSDVWLWAWLEKGATDVNASTNVNPATSAQDAAKVTRSSTNPNIYTITITATTFFNKPASEIQNVGLLLKGRDWSNGQTADKFLTFSESFAIAFAKPTQLTFFVNPGQAIDIEVSTNQAASIVLKVGGNAVASSTGDVTTFTYTHTVTETSGSTEVVAQATKNGETKTKSFTYIIRTATPAQARPSGIIDGINYSTDANKATLSLWAPGKSSVYVLGDFNDFTISPAYQMKKDGEHFWLEITGLISGKEYAYQYLVDETIKIADPYADKILDPDDQYIPTASYPDLKSFPAKALSDQWYFNRLAVLQTGQQAYSWQVSNFQKPAKEKLVIYELLIRDFFENGKRNYQNLIDTVGYLKRLGVNAVELMPIMEFNGNESWGYNPTFMFAPDKYYGTKNKLKAFVDKCHQNGIAVILDIAMNHQDIPNAYVMMDFDFVNMKPEPDNKWFNVTATHPFSVFFDMNHESPYTKKYLDTVNYYWLNEYKVDGFRFDLSKGFTQTNHPTDVGAWSAYDASRIAILKRMADKIWSHTPEAYVILEHLSVNSEEKELAEYRSGEGKGMMLWGKMTDQYNQNTLGFVENSDISGISYASRGWTVPRLVGYMESHDEERLMVKNIKYGNVTTNYSVKDTLNALSRMRAASTLFYTVPGPKMLWQFGELGYDFSINYCPDGSVSEGCRISPKPVKWNYKNESHRQWLYDHIRDLNRLRGSYEVFTKGNVTFSSGSSLSKQITLKSNPYTATPSNPSQMNVVAVANFDVVEKNVSVEFPHSGTWYDYYVDGQSFQVPGSSSSINLLPGGYKLFTDVPLSSTVITNTEVSAERQVSIFPNPCNDRLHIESLNSTISDVIIHSVQGSRFVPKLMEADEWDVSVLPVGLYIVEIRTVNGLYRKKIIKK